MPHERDVPLGIALLFKPSETPAVGGDRRHYIVEAVAIDVVNAHLGSAHPERLWMKLPSTFRRYGGWLFPPSTAVHDVHPAITIDVANPHAVRPSKAGF